ncbi:MAG: M14/M99 family metallopeptidase [Thermodesulfobacteriota bacterium]
MKNSAVPSLLVLLLFFCIIFSGSAADATDFKKSRKAHTVYFENTDYELHVYKIRGEKKGKTVMILGGIQGDEPGGFLTADSYADISLAKGSLIVVPRANLPSILLQKRSVNVDMNRKFADEDAREYEGKIVNILKELISESDCLLNLHDGSGFYYPEWVSEMKNPLRYGQSIIADFDTYKTDNKDVIDLGAMGRRAVKKINENIEQKDLHFRFNNHRTGEKHSVHKEQRKSATYFAVTRCSIPAFGIETNKGLSVEKKVRHHQYAINAFFEEFGVIPEMPPLVLEKPELKYMVVSLNNHTPIVVQKGQTINVEKGSYVKVSHIEANYDRGLTADFIGIGRKNDLRKNIKVEKDVRISAKKDYEPCGSVYIKASDMKKEKDNFFISDKNSGDYFYFQVKVNGQPPFYIENKGELNLKKGDFFEIVDVKTGVCDPGDLEVNIKGYVNDKLNNTGEDRGYIVDTAEDFWEKYAVGKNKNSYPVVVSENGKKIADMLISLDEEKDKFFIVRQKDKFHAVKNGGNLILDSKESCFLYALPGVSENKLNTGFYSLEINGVKNKSLHKKADLNSLIEEGDLSARINLVAEYDDKRKILAGFNITSKE